MAFTQDREQNGMVDKLVAVNRVAKVVKGGRRFSFSAIVVVGDESGRVGWGAGKAKEVPDAVRKATDVAKRRMIRVPLREARTLHHDLRASFAGAKVILRPAKPGRGIIAGGPMRAVFEALGIKDVVAKSLGNSNPYNMIQATFEALSGTQTPRSVASKRGLRMSDMKNNRTTALDAIEAPTEDKTAAEKKATVNPEDVKKKAMQKQADKKAAVKRAAEVKKEALAPEYAAGDNTDAADVSKEAPAETPAAEGEKA
jgi:small subunit ribosomal protein S5